MIDIADDRPGQECMLADTDLWCQALYLRSRDAVYIHDLNGVFLDANPAALALLGYERPEEVRTLTLATLLLPEQLPVALHAIEELKETGSQQDATEFQLRHRDGHLVHVETKASLIVRNGAAVGILGIARDITARKLTEARLRESQERYKRFLQLSVEGIWRIDIMPPVDVALPESTQVRQLLENARVTECNEESARLFGFESAEDMTGRQVSDLIRGGEDDRRQIVADFVRAGYRLAGLENRIPQADGRILWTLGTVIGNVQNGRLVSCWCTRRDISEIKEHEERLRASEEEYRQLFELGSDVLCIIENRTGRILEANSAAVALYGYTREELLQLRNTDVSAEPDRTREATTTEMTRIPVRWHKKRDGTRFPVEITARHFNWRGHFVHVAAIRDISERLRIQEERRNLEAQLQHAQKLEGVGRLAGGMAHDFNNLLTVINGYGDLALKQLHKDDPLHHCVAEIRSAGDRAARLISQLLAFSRKQIIEPEALDLNAVLSDAGRMLQRLAGEDIRFVTRLAPSAGCVMADPGQIHQVLMNLTVNARDAMPEGGTLTIETSDVEIDGPSATAVHPGMVSGPYTLLTVADTGLGMDEKTIQHIFEPFFTTKEKGVGTGLGLSTVYGIVTQSGGWISVESALGRGTTFRIYLPRIAASLVATEFAAAPSGSITGSETVLIVEDQQEVRQFMTEVLRGYGYRVLESTDGQSALIRAEGYPGPIHLLLTDVVMPGMTGRELADSLRRSRPSMKVLYASGYAENVISCRGVLAPEVAFIAKPFTPTELAQKVREILPPRTILVVDDDESIVNLLSGVLKTAGYHVVGARDGEEALSMVRHHNPDLVITDLVMPERDGIEIVRQLNRERPDLRIAAMSGAFDGQFLKMSRMLGASAALRKPIDANELLMVVRGLIG